MRGGWQGCGCCITAGPWQPGFSPWHQPQSFLPASPARCCRFAQLDEANFRAFDSGFSSHPAWLALQQRGEAEAAHLVRLLDELQSAAAAAQEEPAGRAPQ